MSGRHSVILRALTLAVLVSLWAGGDLFATQNIVMKAFYPVPYGEYQNLVIRNAFKVGTQQPLSTGFPVATDVVASTSKIYGNAVFHNNVSLTSGGLFRVNPGQGPYGKDGLRVSGSVSPQGAATGKVMIGSDDSENRAGTATWTDSYLRTGTARLKAHTVLAGQELYALDYSLPSVTVSGTAGNHIYGHIRGFTDTSRTVTGEQKKVQFRALYDNATDPTSGAGFTDDSLFGPLLLDGYYVRFGEKVLDRNNLSYLGYMHTVLIGTQKPWYKAAQTDPWQPQLFLQIGRPSDGTTASGDFVRFCSRELKKDIVPFTPAQYADALAKVESTPIYRYYDKGGEKFGRRFGVILETTPEEMLAPDNSSMDIGAAQCYLAAALKELKMKNDALKARLEALEKQKLALEASGR